MFGKWHLGDTPGRFPTDPKELYPIDKVDVSASWVFPVVLKKVVEFQKTLAVELPIRLGTPDPYVPPKKISRK